MTRFQQTRLNIGITVLFLVLAVAAAVTIRIFYTKDWGIVLFFPMLVSFAFFRRNSRHSKRMPDSASTAKPDESAGPDGRQLAEREQLQQAEKLRHAIMSIGSTLDMREVKERILISLKTLLPCREASLRLFRGGVVDEDGLNGILPRLQERGRPIMETRQDAVCLYLPVYTEHRLRGVMTLRHDRPYLQHEVSLAFTYASQVGIFLENAELYQRMQKMATTDALTGICNRGHFFERAEQKFAEAARNGRHLGAILFDIDHFKKGQRPARTSRRRPGSRLLGPSRPLHA